MDQISAGCIPDHFPDPAAHRPERHPDQLAGLLERWAALIIDWVVMLPIWVVAAWLLPLPECVVALVWLCYAVLMTRLCGATLGKLAAHIQVRRQDGGRITWRASFIRHLVLGAALALTVAVDAAVPLLLPDPYALVLEEVIWLCPLLYIALGARVAERDPHRQSLHDRAARTVVVRTAVRA